MENSELAGKLATGIENEADFAALVIAMERSGEVQPRLAAAALEVVRNGVITGEGPTTAGRIHLSRAIDGADTAWVRRILAAGGAQAITRAEAEILFEIHRAAFERADGGAFDDVMTKAIAHHVLAASGHRVPERATALASTTALAGWTCGRSLHGDVAAWLEVRLRRNGRASLPALAALLGAGVHLPAIAMDLAA